jgi:hypothetical protein
LPAALLADLGIIAKAPINHRVSDLISTALNSLLNSPQALAPTGRLPDALARPQVIEALVLRTTLLPTASTATPGAIQAAPQTAPRTAPAGGAPLPAMPQPPAAAGRDAVLAQFRVLLNIAGREVEVNSAQSWPRGTQLLVQVQRDGSLSLLRNLSAPAPAVTPLPSQRPVLDQAVRENLPRQQPLPQLITALQRLSAHPAYARLPEPVRAALARLEASLPTPGQLATPEGLRRALANSGTLLESRLAQQAPPPAATTAQRSGTTPAGPTGTAAQSPPLSQPAAPLPGAAESARANPDLKAQLLQLLQLLPRPARSAAIAPAAADSDIAPTAPLVYSPASLQRSAGPAKAAADDDVGLLLQQLARQLSAALARTELHQLDSMGSRRGLSADPQAPLQSWVLELPIANGRHAESLQLRIARQAGGDGAAEPKARHWVVDLSFDLHRAGALLVQLVLVGNSVSASIWSELPATHQRVRDNITALRDQLDEVGVNVRKVDARLGLPARARRSDGLVDEHT